MDANKFANFRRDVRNNKRLTHTEPELIEKGIQYIKQAAVE